MDRESFLRALWEEADRLVGERTIVRYIAKSMGWDIKRVVLNPMISTLVVAGYIDTDDVGVLHSTKRRIGEALDAYEGVEWTSPRTQRVGGFRDFYRRANQRQRHRSRLGKIESMWCG